MSRDLRSPVFSSAGKPAVLEVSDLFGPLRVGVETQGNWQTVPFIDYAKVREMVSLEQVLSLIQYRFLVKTKWRSYGQCPLKCSTGSRRGSFYLAKNLWFCHACKRGGNQLDLYAAYTQQELYYATVQLCNRLGIIPPLGTGPERLTERDLREYRRREK